MIHVGKCAGATVNEFLSHNNVLVDRIHLKAPDTEILERHIGVVVVLRDPVARVISAFNWRHPSTRPSKEGAHCCPAQDHTDAELAFYQCFDHVNEFAEALDKDTPRGQRARNALTGPEHWKHIGMGYEYYFPTKIMAALGHRLVFAIHTHRLQQDLLDFLKWIHIKPTYKTLPTRHDSDSAFYPKKNDTHLSHKGRRKLTKHLAAEYKIYERLEQLSIDVSNTHQKLFRGSPDLLTQEECCSGFL
jgi:hypothetical protein